MQRLFQTFDRHAVRYLLISGQAAILYGAASFSEDVDVWIDPSARNVAAPIFLEVMPRPPRVGSFAASFRRRRRMDGPVGTIDVVSIEDLVELKKTRRLADYDVITNLVAIRIREAAHPDRPLIQWAAQNAFRAADRATYLKMLGLRRSLAVCQRALLRDLSRLGEKDTAHWSRVIDDLRRLRSREALLAEKTPVRALLAG